MTYTTEEQITFVPVSEPEASITIGDKVYDQCLEDEYFYISRTEPFTFLNANGTEIVETTLTKHCKLGDYKQKIVQHRFKDENGKQKTHHAYVHVLIADQYIENPDPERLTEIDHRDRNPCNNCISNLRRVSRRLNKLNRISDDRQYFTDHISTNAIAVPNFNGHQLDSDEATFWYEPERQMLFVKVDEDRYRSFVLPSDKRFKTRDAEGKMCNIPLNSLNAMCA